MLRFLSWVMVLGLLSLGWAARPASGAKKSVKKSGAKATAKKSGTSGKTAAKKSSVANGKTTAKKSSSSRTASSRSGGRSRRASSGRSSGKKVASWRSRQVTPTPERYKQIQEALAAKGYLKPEDATGVWTADSVDALRRFQADQKIEGSGKINSLSLIALGLGPKRENVATAKPQTPPQPPPPEQ